MRIHTTIQEKTMAAKKPHKYEYDVDMDSDVAAARVLRMVKPGSKVLEIGAGPGSITRRLSGTLECDVVAVEIDPVALKKLEPFARKVYKLDLNNSTWQADLLKTEGSFDYVIAADVLEHLYDPWTTLSAMKSLLNDTGSVILSLPHVGHAAIAGCLVDEDFEYREWGLLDKTHIRFFGVKNVQDLHEKQGLSIEQAEFVVCTPEMTEFSHRWQRLPNDVKRALQRNRFCHVYQIVSRAVPSQKARNRVDLMSLDVPPPTRKTESHWKGLFTSNKPAPDGDSRSTIAPETSARGYSFLSSMMARIRS